MWRQTSSLDYCGCCLFHNTQTSHAYLKSGLELEIVIIVSVPRKSRKIIVKIVGIAFDLRE